MSEPAPEREIEAEEGVPFPYLRYPTMFRSWKNREIYTQLQLVHSFLLLIEGFEPRQLEHSVQAVDDIVKKVISSVKALLDLT